MPLRPAAGRPLAAAQCLPPSGSRLGCASATASASSPPPPPPSTHFYFPLYLFILPINLNDPREAGPRRGPARRAGQWESRSGAEPSASSANGSSLDQRRLAHRRPIECCHPPPPSLAGGSPPGVAERVSGAGGGHAPFASEKVAGSGHTVEGKELLVRLT